MKDWVYLSEHGDDKNNGLEEKAPVRTAAQAIKIANKVGRDIRILGDDKMQARLTAELKRERKEKASSEKYPTTIQQAIEGMVERGEPKLDPQFCERWIKMREAEGWTSEQALDELEEAGKSAAEAIKVKKAMLGQP